jgi:hypothetical protein
MMAGLVQAQELTVSVNFYATDNSGWQKSMETIVGGETYPELEGTNTWWNNVMTNKAGLLWSDGSISSIGVNGGGSPNVIEWNNSTYANSMFRSGNACWAGAVTTLTLTNLNANFPNGCRAVVYMGGPAADVQAAISNNVNSEILYFKPSNPKTIELIEITDTNQVDGIDQGNYITLGSQGSPLTNDTLTVTVFDVPGGRVLFSAVQLIGETASSGIYPQGPEGLLVGWDTGNGLDYRMPNMNGYFFGGSWADNDFNASHDGTFGTLPGASTNYFMGFACNANAPQFTMGFGSFNSTPVILESLNFDFAPGSTNSPDGIRLEEQVIDGGVTSWVEIASVTGLAVPSNGTTRTGYLYDFDWDLSGLNKQVLQPGQWTTLRLTAIGGTDTAVSLLDNVAVFGDVLSHYEGWVYGYDLYNTADGLETADPDGDTIDNLGEYAFGGNPTNGNNTGWQAGLGGTASAGGTNYIEMVYGRRISAASTVTYNLVSRPDLMIGDWADLAGSMEVGTGILVTNNMESVTNWIPLDGSSTGFIRVDVAP